MTVVVADEITYADVRESVDITLGKLEEAAEQLVWQIENRTWTLLGYDSWDEMREAEYGGTVIIVPRADRPELASRLSNEGLSQKQIADTLGVAQQTISNDLGITKIGNTESATRIDSIGRERPTSYQRKPEPPVTYIDTATGEVLPPEPSRFDVLEGERLARYDAEKRSAALGYTLTILSSLTHPDRRAEFIDAWKIAPQGASPAQRVNVTPAAFRAVAAALTALADEWDH